MKKFQILGLEVFLNYINENSSISQAGLALSINQPI